MKAVDHSAVNRLLAQGIPKQRAAAIAGVSRRTVGRIAAGERVEQTLIERCPGCGGKQVMPCQVCQIRTSSAA